MNNKNNHPHICPYCKKEYLGRKDQKFCKRSCSTSNMNLNNPKVQKRELNNNWKGGISTNNYKYKKVQKARFPEKFKSRKITSNAIISGKLIKMPCEKCGDNNSVAHHSDYSDPMNITWLCRKHHREEHGGRY